MAMFQLPLISYEELVSEPIKLQLCKLIGDEVNYVGSSGNKQTNSDGVELVNENIPTVVITERDWNSTYNSNNLYLYNHRYSIIQDETIGLDIKFFDIDKEYQIAVSCKFPTRADAIWWRNNILSNIRNGFSTYTSDLYLSPCIPNKILDLIEQCRLIKVARTVESREFMDYLLGISVETISIDTNSIHNAVAVTFPEKLEKVTLTPPSEVPEPVLDNGKYTLEMEFGLITKVPSGITVKYPIFIGGVMLPKEYVDLTQDSNDDSDVTYFTSGEALDTLIQNDLYVTPEYRSYCYQIPKIENYRFPMKEWGTAPIFQIRIGVDLNDPRLVVNLNDLFNTTIGGYELDTDMLQYFVENKDRILYRSRSAVSVILVKDNGAVNPDLLYIDSGLVLRSKYNLDLVGDYHLVITTHRDTTKLPVDAFETLYKFPTLLNKLIKLTHPKVDYTKLPDVELATITTYRSIFDSIRPSKTITGPITANVLCVNTKK